MGIIGQIVRELHQSYSSASLQAAQNDCHRPPDNIIVTRQSLLIAVLISTYVPGR
jgi:hypothetical protein